MAYTIYTYSHLFDLLPHRCDLGFAGLDLRLQLLDLVVQDELELLELLRRALVAK